MNERTKLLVLSVAGIGNTILQSACINALLGQPDLEVHALFGDQGMSEIFAHEARISKRYTIPLDFISKVRLVRVLREQRYDASISCFPSNRYEYNMLPVLAGISRRIIHHYSAKRIRSLQFLATQLVPTHREMHDVEQNMELLRALGIEPEQQSNAISISIADADVRFAEAFLSGMQPGLIVGIHPSGTRNLPEKDWPPERFEELIEKLEPNYNVILFGLEKELRRYKRGDKVRHCIATIPGSAAVINRCDIFVSVDTGLMHVAAALKKPQLVLWGPTLFSRTRPWNDRARFLGRTDLKILKYPFEDTRARFHHPDAGQFLRAITVDEVHGTIQQMLAAEGTNV